jgi:hypothetical protein
VLAALPPVMSLTSRTTKESPSRPHLTISVYPGSSNILRYGVSLCDPVSRADVLWLGVPIQFANLQGRTELAMVLAGYEDFQTLSP